MRRVLPVIVLSQFFCTSLWFAGNAIIGDIARQLAVDPGYLAHLASAVQFGFITGTLIFAVLSIADRFSPVGVFFCCAILGALINLTIIIPGISSPGLLTIRFLTGFFLAGIYPVGMKIASDHYQQGLGRSLGFLVGALVLGTAFPHLLKSLTAALPWRYVIYSTSALAALGGTAMWLLVPNGPHRVMGQKINFGGFLAGFRNIDFRAAAFGYFGHQWELYAFWVFIPVILAAFKAHNQGAAFSIPLLSFLIIASGSLACVLSGIISQTIGAKKTATIALGISCACGLLSPLVFFGHSVVLLIAFMFLWGTTVVADSPLYSTLVAQNAPANAKGTSLTIVNSIGFAITIISIQLINMIRTDANAPYIYTVLAIGPVIGLVALLRKGKHRPANKKAPPVYQ